VRKAPAHELRMGDGRPNAREVNESGRSRALPQSRGSAARLGAKMRIFSTRSCGRFGRTRFAGAFGAWNVIQMRPRESALRDLRVCGGQRRGHERMRLRFLAKPAGAALKCRRGRHLYIEQGNIGVDAFDWLTEAGEAGAQR